MKNNAFATTIRMKKNIFVGSFNATPSYVLSGSSETTSASVSEMKNNPAYTVIIDANSE